jgi:hypothetical protein
MKRFSEEVLTVAKCKCELEERFKLWFGGSGGYVHDKVGSKHY